MDSTPKLLLLAGYLVTSCAGSPEAESPVPPVPLRIEAREGTDIALVQLRHADAQELAGTITELLEACLEAAFQRQDGCALWPPDAVRPLPKPMARIVADPRTNSVLIQAVPEDMPQLLEIVERLDHMEW